VGDELISGRLTGSLRMCCLLVIAAWTVCGITSCGIWTSEVTEFWQADLDSIQQDKAGIVVSYEEKPGEILVSLADRTGRCDTFRVNHPGKSTKETLSILKAKQAEQKKTKPNPTSEGLRQPADGSPKPST
jgi:hypothetical protein